MDIKRIALVVTTLLLAALLAACATTEPTQPPAQDTALPGTAWALTSLKGEALIVGTQITLSFSETSINGSAGCNTYGGSYTAAEDSLSLSDLYWTEMACLDPEGVLDQELAYLNTLNTAASYRVDAGRLELYDEAGALILAFGLGGTDLPVSTEPPQGSTLVATLEAPECLPSGAAVPVKFTLTNVSSEGLYILKWFTPLEGLAGDIFQVRRDVLSLPYRGIQVKRAEPTSEGYVWLDAGASVSAEVDLAEGYDLTQAGEYTIQFRAPRLSHIAATAADQATTFEELAPVEIPSNPITVTIE